MPEKVFVKDFDMGLQVSEILYLDDKKLKVSARGESFLDLSLRDRTGSINAKIWKNAEQIGASFSQGDFVAVTGEVESYRERLQLRVKDIRRADRAQVVLEDFIRALEPEKAEAYMADILKIMDEVKDPHIRQLLDLFFKDPALQEKFRKCPAAMSIHHDMAGGLLKHTRTMLAVAHFLAKKIYREVNYDLLVAGILLHDIGKLDELSMDISIDYTDQGRLLGHSIIGARMMREKAAQISGFPERLATLLEHIFISHHGEPDFGAIRRPVIREALLVHFIDTMDAKMEIIDKSLRSLGQNEIWSDKCWALGDQRLLDTEAFLELAGDEKNY